MGRHSSSGTRLFRRRSGREGRRLAIFEKDQQQGEEGGTEKEGSENMRGQEPRNAMLEKRGPLGKRHNP